MWPSRVVEEGLVILGKVYNFQQPAYYRDRSVTSGSNHIPLLAPAATNRALRLQEFGNYCYILGWCLARVGLGET